jgi:hypothetical protein
MVAIDYKTSSTPPKGVKDASGKLSVDVQIPLYSSVALKHLYPDGTLGSSAYYSLTKGKTLREEKPDDVLKLDDFSVRIKQALAAGHFAAGPDVNEHACTYCDHDLVCRKGPRLDRKPTQDDPQ